MGLERSQEHMGRPLITPKLLKDSAGWYEKMDKTQFSHPKPGMPSSPSMLSEPYTNSLNIFLFLNFKA